MRGIFLCSLALLIPAMAADAAPAAGPGSGRRHEIQLRRNDYAAVPAPSLLREAGLAKAILRVFSDDERNGGLYFSSGLFPVARPALDQWAGKYSAGPVPLWAWMGTRKFAWLRDAGLIDREWRAGEARPIHKLDLFNPRALELLVKLFGQLARQPIRGILIQDDLTLMQNEGFSSWGRACFASQARLEADPRRMLSRGSAHHGSWEDLKARRVGEVLARIVAACRDANPAIEIGLNVHYEAPLTPERARSWYAFDAAAASAAGVDLFYLMAYHRQMKAEMKLGEGDARIYFRLMLEAASRLWGPKLVAKMQVRDWKSSEPIPLEELKTYYNLIPPGVERVCFAAADPEDLGLISRIIDPAR